jgi:hypothetical protein
MSLFPEVADYPMLLEKFSLSWDTHLNADAHERWARGLAKLLVKKRLVGNSDK